MTSVILKLKKVSYASWALFGPNGNQISHVFRGEPHKVREAARIFVSSWYNWTVDYSECYSEGETINEQPKKN